MEKVLIKKDESSKRKDLKKQLDICAKREEKIHQARLQEFLRMEKINSKGIKVYF